MNSSAETRKVAPEQPSALVSRLTAAEEESFLQRARASLRKARLNAHYTPAARLVPHLTAMGQASHGGLHAALELDRRSGLPTFRQWTRVLTDHQLAAEFLAQLPAERELAARARQAPTSIHGKQWLKRRYYQQLTELDIQPIDAMVVDLRRIDAATRRAYFRVVLDKLTGQGGVVRYTIELGQTDSIWDRPMLTLDDDQAAHTEEFRSLIFRFAAVDAELTFAHLASRGLHIERVVRSEIGPFFSSRTSSNGSSSSRTISEILTESQHPGTLVASFSCQIAAVDLASDRHNDPLETGFADRLSVQARREYEAARKRYGYHVFKDRKFVVAGCGDLGGRIRQLCAERGTRNIVYRLE